MSADVFRYEFDPAVNTNEVESTIVLALVATESLHGETATQLGVSHFFERERRVCIVDAHGEAGRDFNSLLAGFFRKEFGRDSFHVRRVEAAEVAATTAA